MQEKTFDTLFHDHLKDIYYAEKKIYKVLPKMEKAAQSPQLKAAFAKHREETEGQIERLEQVFEIFGKRAQGKTCLAIDGILEESTEVMEEYKDSPALDAGLVASAQAVEHYEIARYTTLRRLALLIGLNDAARLLDETLKQETKTDMDLSKLADMQTDGPAIRKVA